MSLDVCLLKLSNFFDCEWSDKWTVFRMMHVWGEGVEGKSQLTLLEQ